MNASALIFSILCWNPVDLRGGVGISENWGFSWVFKSSSNILHIHPEKG
jgi:hypothetical protein